jgi:hypothetical protein
MIFLKVGKHSTVKCKMQVVHLTNFHGSSSDYIKGNVSGSKKKRQQQQ